MVLSKAATESDGSVHSTFASRYVRTSLPRFRMPDNSIPKEAAWQIINDELMLDGNPRLNLASFVTTWMDPESAPEKYLSGLLLDGDSEEFKDVVCKQLERLAADRDDAIRRADLSSSSDEASLGLSFSNALFCRL